jgi:hypothetical protein
VTDHEEPSFEPVRVHLASYLTDWILRSTCSASALSTSKAHRWLRSPILVRPTVHQQRPYLGLRATQSLEHRRSPLRCNFGWCHAGKNLCIRSRPFWFLLRYTISSDRNQDVSSSISKTYSGFIGPKKRWRCHRCLDEVIAGHSVLPVYPWR